MGFKLGVELTLPCDEDDDDDDNDEDEGGEGPDGDLDRDNARFSPPLLRGLRLPLKARNADAAPSPLQVTRVRSLGFFSFGRSGDFGDPELIR